MLATVTAVAFIIHNPTLIGMAVSAAPEAVAATGKAAGAVARATATAATNAAGWMRLKLAQGYVWGDGGWYKPSWSSYQPLFGDDPMINPGGLNSVGLGLGKLKPPASGQRSQPRKAKEKAPRVATEKATRAEAKGAGTRSTAAAPEPREKPRSAQTSHARKTRSATAVADAAPSNAADVSTATGALDAVEERHYRTRLQAKKEQQQASTKATDETGSPQDPEDPQDPDSDSDEEEEDKDKTTHNDEASAQEGDDCSWKDCTGKRSLPNSQTNATRKQFEENLQRDGWSKSVSKDGKIVNYTKDGARYGIRNDAKSTNEPTAEYYKSGNTGKADIKIRLQKG